MSRPIANVGIAEVPWGGTEQQRTFNQWVYNTLLGLQDALIPPGIPTNFRATALAGAIQVDFTRSDADHFVLYWNTTPSINGAVLIDLGSGNKYVDTIGSGSVKRWYSVQARKGNVIGALSEWKSATTLALGTPVTPPEPPPATETPFVNTETDTVAVEYPDKGTYSQL